MRTINSEPIEVDFNNSDEDRAVRLFLPLKTMALKDMDLELVDGMNVWISDGEIEAIGTTTFRGGIWVAVLDENSVKSLDKNSPFHIDNQK